MKLIPTFFAAFLIGAAGLTAAPSSENTAVYSQPDTSSTVIGSLRAGSEPAPASGVNAPAGWTAVTLVGPHEVYAANKDVTKSLDVRAGAPYFIEAKSDAPALTLAEKGDAVEIIDYRGKWTKFRLSKPVTGYIRSSAKPVVVTSASSSSANVASAVVNDPVSAAPAQPVTAVGKAAPMGDGGSSALPRLFQGTFTSTYSPLRPRRPYDFQLNDDAGSRYAYVDVSKLLATEQLNKYVGRTVVVYGTARSVSGGRDMVVIAESLQLR